MKNEKYTAYVVRQDAIIPDFLYSLVLNVPEIASKVHPGQLVHVKVGEENSSFSLRRPFSVAYSDNDTLCIRYNIVGDGTKWMSSIKAGDVLDLIGPVGNGWDISGHGNILLVGGGTGIFSLLGASKQLGNRAKALLGFRTASLVNSANDFNSFGTPVSIITDDGSSGRRGFVTELLREELELRGWDAVYICGPHGMMKNTSELSLSYGVKTYVSLEEHMGCGIGACMACVCKMVKGSGTEYRRVCVDGPVFNAEEVIW